MRKFSVLAIAAVFLVPFAASSSVGVSPGFIDLGEVQPGQERQVDFYITTNDIDQEFTVSPEYKKAVVTYTGGEDPLIDISNASDQDISPWISFDEKPKTIDPDTSETYTLPDGSSVNANGVVTMTIDIPANTEPGYRIGQVEMNAELPTQEGGGGAQLIAESRPGFAFRTPGPVERNIEHVGIEAIRIGENEVQIIHQVRNTGTVTTSLSSGTVKVYDSRGSTVGSYFTTSPTLEPGEYAEMDRQWGGGNVEGGEYRVEGTAEYEPSEMYISGEFAITDAIQERREVEEASGGVADDPGNVPGVLVLIRSMLVGVLLYLMDVEPTWIIAITAFTLFSLYILLGPASLYLLLIPLVSVVILMYL